MIDARIHASAGGAILFDAALAAQADEAWFDPAAWEARGLLEGHGGGRGQVTFVRAPFGACALRHYHRGGMVARVLGDRYLWTGMESTRSFARSLQIPVIASGGVSTLGDIASLLPLEGEGVRGVIVGRALYAGTLDLREAISLAERKPG